MAGRRRLCCIRIRREEKNLRFQILDLRFEREKNDV